MEDAMIYFGGEVKALNDSGLVGGYLVRFTDAKRKDLSGEYFTAKTYLGPKDGDGAESLFDHGYPIPIPDGIDSVAKSTLIALADHTFAPLKTKRDAVGIWAEVVLNLADDYEKHVYGMVQKKKLGWSSGSAGHRVRKNKDGEITAWPIAEGSLTHSPCEPMNRAISMKSFGDVKFLPIEDPDETDEPDTENKLPAKSLAARLTQFIADSVDSGRSREDMIKQLARETLLDAPTIERLLTGEFRPVTAHLKAVARVLGLPWETLKAISDKSEPRTIKGMFEDELANQQPSLWTLWDAYRCVVRKIAEAKSSTMEAGVEFDETGKIEEASNEFIVRVKASVLAQVAEYAGNDAEEFYLKNGFVIDGSLVTEGLDFDEHSELVVTAFREIVKRFRDNHEMRKSTKAGRVLSDKNRQRLVKMLDAIQTAVTDCQSLLEETKPMANPTEKRAAYIDHLRTETELLRQSIGV